MASHGHDIFHYLYDRAPAWLANIRTISRDADRRHAELEDVPEIWQLSPEANEITASAFSLFDSSAPALTFSGSTIPYPSSKTDARPRSGRKDVPPQPPHVEHSRRRSQYLGSLIMYDGEAQSMLANIVSEVGHAVGLITRSPHRGELSDISSRLLRASNMCHDAAFQLLRDGRCSPHSSTASTIFQDLFVISCIEVMHERKQRETFGIDPPTTYSKPTPPTVQPQMQLQSIEAPKHINVPAVRMVCLDDPVADDDATSADDFSIGPIRLTSRMR